MPAPPSSCWRPPWLPNSLRAAGDNRYVMYAASSTVVLLRVGFSYIFGTLMDLQVCSGIWYAMYLDWIGRSIFLWRYRSDS